MKGKKSFLLYCDQQGLFRQLPDKEAGQLIKLIFSYVNDENPVIEDLLLKVAFEPIKLQLKRDLLNWNSIRELRSIAGKKGGKASGKSRKQNKANEASASNPKQNEANEAVTVNVTVNDTVTDINQSIEYRIIAFKKLVLKVDNILDSFEIKKFVDYWTEHGPKARKVRWEKEKVFDIKKRMSRWKSNIKPNQYGGSAKDDHQRVNDALGSGANLS